MTVAAFALEALRGPCRYDVRHLLVRPGSTTSRVEAGPRTVLCAAGRCSGSRVARRGVGFNSPCDGVVRVVAGGGVEHDRGIRDASGDGPPMSWLSDSGTMPSRLNSPCVGAADEALVRGRDADRPHRVGALPLRAKFAAMAAPVPPLDPPGLRVRSYGFFVWPPSELIVVMLLRTRSCWPCRGTRRRLPAAFAR